MQLHYNCTVCSLFSLASSTLIPSTSGRVVPPYSIPIVVVEPPRDARQSSQAADIEVGSNGGQRRS